MPSNSAIRSPDPESLHRAILSLADPNGLAVPDASCRDDAEIVRDLHSILHLVKTKGQSRVGFERIISTKMPQQLVHRLRQSPESVSYRTARAIERIPILSHTHLYHILLDLTDVFLSASHLQQGDGLARSFSGPPLRVSRYFRHHRASSYRRHNCSLTDSRNIAQQFVLTIIG